MLSGQGTVPYELVETSQEIWASVEDDRPVCVSNDVHAKTDAKPKGMSLGQRG